MTTGSIFRTDRERAVASSIAELSVCNPFVPRRIELEREILGDELIPSGVVWHPGKGDVDNPNLEPLRTAARAMTATLHRRLARVDRAPDEELAIYRDTAVYSLYTRFEGDLFQLMREDGSTTAFGPWNRFRRAATKLLAPVAESGLQGAHPPAHLLASMFQVRRAFHFIFRFILGRSTVTGALRAEVWNSVFGHDLARYTRSLYRQMGRLTTLVTGPSGTGKELVARAIGMSRFIPFDPEGGRFTDDFRTCFFPLNLSALSPTLIESELFGHRRGSFTGAVEDRTGWFEACPALGTVFLDEIGNVDEAIQVKLLRVLEDATFQRLGETQTRRFEGKVVAATNRDLARAMQEGRFRTDLYYRLCGDTVQVPALITRLREDSGELRELVAHLAREIAGPDEAIGLAAEVETWIDAELGPDYEWPGNVRELAQCVRNILVRGSYRPAATPATTDPADHLARDMRSADLTAEELLARYTALVHQRCGSYVEAGRRLGLDRRTVKRYVEMTAGD